MSHSKGPFLSVTHGVQSIGVDAQINEERFDRLGTSFPQGDIVLIRAAIIAMPFHRNRYIRVRAQILGLGDQNLPGPVRQQITVEFEMDILSYKRRQGGFTGSGFRLRSVCFELFVRLGSLGGAVLRLLCFLLLDLCSSRRFRLGLGRLFGTRCRKQHNRQYHDQSNSQLSLASHSIFSFVLLSTPRLRAL